ncbi:drebrin-like protein [Rhopilema esculentum]|uniref:drebrin-like protein n=1 Tax=Rhopilema esculentum TaxID=499914 RepID=UPI0031CDE597
MAKVDLVKNKAALEQAWKEVTRPESKINWAVFGYDGKTFTLKVVETGEDGFEEMADELNGGKIMYAVCRVNDPNTNLPKLVFVNWQGEGVPANVKGVCANHIRDVTSLFKGCHVTINARSENDLDYDSVLDKVKKSSGANYSIHKEKPKPVEQIKPVGAVYKKINPIREIDIKKRDTFWNKQEEEERSRVSQEKQMTEKKRQEEEEKRKAREKKEEVARDEMIRERSKSIDQQRAAMVKQEPKREEEKKRYQDMMKEKERDDQEFRKRSDSERKKRLQEVQSAISSRQSVDSERSKFAPAAKSKVPPPTQPKKKVPKVINEPQEAVQQQYVSTVDTTHDEPSPVQEQAPVVIEEQKELPPSPVQEQAPVVIEEQKELPHVPAVAQDLPEPDQQTFSTEAEVEQQSEEVDHQSQAAETEKEPEITSGTQNVCTARALFDYRAEGQDEISFDPGDIIEGIEKVDEGWWRGTAPSGAYGLFPANYVEIIDNEEVRELHSIASECGYSQWSNCEGEGQDEISFDPGDIIEGIEKVDEGWWRGTAPSGAYGLFPANYVEIIDNEEKQPTVTPTIQAPASQAEEQTPASQAEEQAPASQAEEPAPASQGLSAKALYDYQAEGEDEVSFDPGDIIEEIEKVDDGWWKGRAPSGAYGLFPANYVELLDSQEATGTTESQPEEAQMTSQPQGISARALYDYQAADETEISFDPDDVITEIDQCDENWWRGQAPDGRYGMFPANYVELI